MCTMIDTSPFLLNPSFQQNIFTNETKSMVLPLPPNIIRFHLNGWWARIKMHTNQTHVYLYIVYVILKCCTMCTELNTMMFFSFILRLISLKLITAFYTERYCSCTACIDANTLLSTLQYWSNSVCRVNVIFETI